MKLAAEWTGEEPIANRPSRFFIYRDIIPSYRTLADLGLPLLEMMAMRNELKYFWSRMEDLDTVLERVARKIREDFCV